MSNIKITSQTEGELLSIAGGSYRVLVSGSETNGEYAVIEMTVPVGKGPGPHAHKDFSELFYVSKGEVTFKSQDGSQLVGKGGNVMIPAGGEIHCFKNTGNSDAVLLCTVIPAGLDAFFREAEKLNPSVPPNAETVQKLKELGTKYGQEFYPPDFLD